MSRWFESSGWRVRKFIFLSGLPGAGKSTLANALRHEFGLEVVSTSDKLRKLSGSTDEAELYEFGARLDQDRPEWFCQFGTGLMVVDAVRTHGQHLVARARPDAICVNVQADFDTRASRSASRGRGLTNPSYWFDYPDFSWDSVRVPLGVAVRTIGYLIGAGSVDLVVGGQYGSEGKGKLCAALAGRYGALVRSGGPNAGHWVRERHYERCFHQVPSGALANPEARLMIAAGATINLPGLEAEADSVGAFGRILVDRNTALISEHHKELEIPLRETIGSTSQGVGACAAERVARRDTGVPTMGRLFPDHSWTGVVAPALEAILRHSDVLIEGTQGSALSLYHGPYPFVTSRDTNASGLLSEVGLAPSLVRDTWMVVRTFPIRVGGNSGPMRSELDWEAMAGQARVDRGVLMKRETTSTTGRQRRIAEFDWEQFNQACAINRPTKLFLTFADYLDPDCAGTDDWHKLGAVSEFVHKLELASGAVVAGVSTGAMQHQTAWRVRP